VLSAHNLRIMRYDNIDQYMTHNRLDGKQLAGKLGISESYMSLLRFGKRRPSPDLAQKIENITGIPFKNLLIKKGRNE
jgi:transcriptional regulator with XRE-family HTH domain